MNGYRLNDVTLPNELVTCILSFVDVGDLLRCRLVCKEWDVIVTTNPLWYMKFKRRQNSLPGKYSWEMYYCYFDDQLEKNLLRNVSGEEEFRHWKTLRNGGDGFVVEKRPVGCDPLPPNIPELHGHESCFVTSYQWCIKSQSVNLKRCPILRRAINKYKPAIHVSEWVAKRFDCGGMYMCKVTVHCRNENNVTKRQCTLETDESPNWRKVNTTLRIEPTLSDVWSSSRRHRRIKTLFSLG